VRVALWRVQSLQQHNAATPPTGAAGQQQLQQMGPTLQRHHHSLHRRQQQHGGSLQRRIGACRQLLQVSWVVGDAAYHDAVLHRPSLYERIENLGAGTTHCCTFSGPSACSCLSSRLALWLVGCIGRRGQGAAVHRREMDQLAARSVAVINHHSSHYCIFGMCAYMLLSSSASNALGYG